MKFYNNTLSISSVNTPYALITNNNQKAAIIITLQIINNNSQISTVVFKRRKIQTGQFTQYVSNIKLKQGTTIMDHLTVVQPGIEYTIQSPKTNIIVSCSYGI